MMQSINKTLCNRPQSSYESLQNALKRIIEFDELNAFITVMEESSVKQARESDKRFQSNIPIGKLDGTVVAVKDNFCTKDSVTTCASNMLRNFRPNYDATVVKRLVDSGAVIIGKTNLDEFAMGSGTVDSVFGATKNVWKSKMDSGGGSPDWRIAGGSSGGSAVAVAIGACKAALGSDSGGSTRNPASYCGVVGYKPTYGTVSRYGLIPLVNSMDVPGILARSVQDVANVYNVISGPDILDSTTVDDRFPPINLENEFSLKGISVGIPKEYRNSDDISQEVMDTWNYMAQLLENAGARITEVSMPHTAASIVTYSILNQCEVASNMARYSGLLFGHRAQTKISTDRLIMESRRQGLGSVVRSRILAGNYFLLKRNYEKYFAKAMKVRRLIANDFDNVWKGGVHFLLTPTTLTTAPTLSSFVSLDNRAQCALQDYCTQPANMAGCPAISIPISISKEGLPISLQLMAKNFDDASLLAIAKFIECAVSFSHLYSLSN